MTGMSTQSDEAEPGPPQSRGLRADTGSIARWWRALNDREHGDRAGRAALRRVDSIAAALCESAFCDFLRASGQIALLTKPEPSTLDRRKLEALACVAAVLSHVESDAATGTETDDAAHVHATFGGELARSKPGGSEPRVSALRFRQLVESTEPDEFLRRLIRTVALLGRTAPVAALARDILDWFAERGIERAGIEPARRATVRWALDYYAAQPERPRTG